VTDEVILAQAQYCR